jgi:hypothetical protein
MSDALPRYLFGLRLQARAANSLGHTDGIALRGSQAHGMRARRLRDKP